MTGVPTLGEKNLADSITIYGRGRELFRPPTYASQYTNFLLKRLLVSVLRSDTTFSDPSLW
jgi:hypothetical protein